MFKSKTSLVLSVIALLGCSNGQPEDGNPVASSAPTRPNVILIVIDTARADHFSSYGYNLPTTPNIDTLVKDSVRFSNAHSVAPWTLPAHMSMFSGMLPGQHGATWEAFSQPPGMSVREMMSRRFQLSDPDRMLAHRLKAAGYRTWGISSNPWVGERTGFAAGFDSFAEVWRLVSGFPQYYAGLPSGLKIDAELDRTLTGMSLVLFKHEVTTNDARGPFFAFFNLVDTHYPYTPPPDFVQRFSGNPEVYARISRRPEEFTELALLGGYRPFDLEELIPFYDAELSYVDFMLGNLIGWLQQENLYDPTLIVITSDHGEHLGENDRISHQLSIEQELLAVPLIIKYPDSAHAGVVVDSPLVANLDVYETILAATGGTAETESVDSSSVDLTPLTSGGAIDRRQLLAESYYSDAYLRQVKAHHGAFDESAHRVVRRAVYMDGYKIMFEDSNPRSVEPVAPADAPPDLAAVQAALRRYVQSIGGSGFQRLEPTAEDRELIERLESLGYLDGTTKPATQAGEVRDPLN